MILIVFIFGLVVGSFLNVLIYRSVRGENWVTGRSRCDHCRKIIPWYDNVPLFSFLVLRGKCRFCHKAIALQHPAIEMMTALLFAWWYAIGFTFFRLVEAPLTIIQPGFWLIVGIFMLIIFIADWLYQIIPDFANIGLLGLALIYRIYLSYVHIMRWEDFAYALITGVVMMTLLFIIWLLSKGRGMGFGDVKFALGMGILLGWPRAMVAFLLAFWLGALFGIILIVFRIKKMKDKIAFGPFLIMGTAIALVIGNQLWNAYIKLAGW